MQPAPATRLTTGRRITMRVASVPEPRPRLDTTGVLPDAEGVHLVAHEREDRGQQRHRGGHGDRGRRRSRLAARLRKIVVRDDRACPSSARTTVIPLKNTARLAVPPARADRLELLAPVEPLLPVPSHDEERIVDPHRQTDHRDHVLHEEREVDDLPGQSGRAHRDRDGEGREDERDEPRDHRAEDDDAARSAPRSTPMPLALRDVLLDDLVELVEEGRRARPRGSRSPPADRRT